MKSDAVDVREASVYKNEPYIPVSKEEIHKLAQWFRYDLVGKFSHLKPLLLVVQQDEDEIQKSVVDYFQKILTKETTEDGSEILESISNIISSEDNRFLNASPSVEEGLDKLFSTHSNLDYVYGGGVPISHLVFADDMIIFTNGQRNSLTKVMEFIRSYTKGSGQNINCSKSSFTVTKDKYKGVVEVVTGFQFQALPITYLGVPLCKGRKKCVLFEGLVNKIKNRLLGWEHKVMFAGGKLIFLKHVLNSIHLHILQVMDPPMGVMNRISKLFNAYIREETSQTKQIHWTTWEKICFPNIEGEICCRLMKDMSMAFDCNLWWKFRKQESLWSWVMKAKYCRLGHAKLITTRPRDSPLWRRMH
ncbi:Uncharacterized protein Adt_31626 [Abeliophyllum distichum]|uniref:Reverse transcriptase domain-containing protein n=1 Tax=Abeliophyllum distichum TaxID=126358 RepID=A0ABD1REM6_9LAMI